MHTSLRAAHLVEPHLDQSNADRRSLSRLIGCRDYGKLSKDCMGRSGSPTPSTCVASSAQQPADLPCRLQPNQRSVSGISGVKPVKRAKEQQNGRERQKGDGPDAADIDAEKVNGVAVKFINNPCGTPLTTIVEQRSTSTLHAGGPYARTTTVAAQPAAGMQKLSVDHFNPTGYWEYNGTGSRRYRRSWTRSGISNRLSRLSVESSCAAARNGIAVFPHPVE